MSDLHQQVVDTIVRWALNLPMPEGRSRVNLKLLFGETVTAHAVRDALQARSNDRCAYVVRGSTDTDAVRLRNERPAGLALNAAIIYIVFWLPGQPGHEKNFESLRDFRSVTLPDLLRGADSFVFPEEKAIEEQCGPAAQAWPQNERTRAEVHLLTACRALRMCVRERRGGRDRSIPFVERLEDYLDYLTEARVPEDVWQQTPINERPKVLVETWGQALWRLSMFCLPALASVIRIHVDPSKPVPSGKDAPEARWVDALEQILAENKEIATDFAGLGESIAGHQTVRERLDALTLKIPLCQTEGRRIEARNALEHFCHSGDDAALRQVEWLFLQNPADRRSASFGLKGLLIARKLREPRENPLDRAARETTTLLETVAGADAHQSGVVRQFVEDRKNRAALDRREAMAMADLLESIAEGAVTSSLQSPAIAPIIDKVLAAPERNPVDFERLARMWEKLGRPDADAPIVENALLLGLVQLTYARLREQVPVGDHHAMVPNGELPGQLKLTAAVEGERTSLVVDAADWTQQARTDIYRWLVQKVRPLYFDADDAAVDDEQDEQPVAITLDVEWQHAGVTKTLGVIEIPIRSQPAELLSRSRSTTLASVKCDGDPEVGRLLRELFETSEATVFAEDPRDEGLSAAWADYVRAVGVDRGWGAVASIAPLPGAAEGWVNAWARAVTNVGAHGQIAQELRLINEKIREEIQAGGARLAELFDRQQELQKAQQDGPAVDIQTVRSILRLCTGRTESSGQVRRLVLTPHHPLVLRLRLVGEEILATTLRQLWTVGWDRRTLDDLDGALAEWGLPEPIHAYGFWDGEPLVFDGWTHDHFASFSSLGRGSEMDAQELGARQIARELERYSELFPAAADRLRIRLKADPQGHWAWRLLSERLGSPRFAADVELLTDLPPRQPLAIDQHARADELLSHAFEPGSDGELPRVRVLRRRISPPSAGGDVHISAVIGDLVDELRPTMSPMAVDGEITAYDILDPRVFYQEPVPDLREFSFLVGDSPDRLSQAVAKAVGIAAGQPNQVFRERYSFDPTRCRYPLEQLQANAHWLVLASRQSLYRAVQQCATSTLLDFYTVTERRRPVHICVSLDRRNADEDVKRLRLLLESLLGIEIDAAQTESVLSAARTLAPGLAIRCVGSTGGIDLSGLVGLLLSARSVEAEGLGGLLLALDQHRDLLAGGGQLSDLLRIRMKGQEVSVDVIEAKFSTGALSLRSAAVVEAQQQVRSTIERLAQFSLDHPLILRTRSRLVRAITHRIHLGAAQGSAGEWKELLDAVLDPKVKISIGHDASAIHGWSIDAATQDLATLLSTGETLHVHGRETTVKRLRALS